MIVDQTFRDRWRSGLHTGQTVLGQSTPRTIVKIQRGLMDRAFRAFEGEDADFGYIGGSKHNDKPWHAFWRATGDWIELPNVQHVETSVEFQQQTGMADPETATIVIDNIVYEDTIGTGGLFHRIRRGWMSPWRGWTNPGDLKAGGRTEQPGTQRNEWFDVLNGGFRVRIWQGYGDALAPVFTGLIDDTDIGDTPDQITLTCRSFGALLTDQRVFGSNKAMELRSPIVFHDRLRADKTVAAGGGANASTFDPAHPPVNVTKKGDETFWLSHGHSTEDNTEWVQVRLPKGRYTEFYVAPGYDGMEMYLSIYARHKGMKTRARVDGVDVDDGWITRGLGTVPGVNGGHPYCYRWGSVSKGGLKRRLPFELECGDDTVLRVSFRLLQRSPEKGDYRAKCFRLAGFKAKRKSSANKKHWILVDDAADVIKWVLMWAGFKNWHVEPMGIRLKNPYMVDQTKFLADVISDALGSADYTFYIDGFDDTNENDIGTPHFEPVRAIRPPAAQMEEIKDTDLLTDINVKFAKEPLAYIIRVRGKIVDPHKGEEGVELGGDTAKRVMAVYLPPWSGAHHDVVNGQYSQNYPFAGRLAGVRKHVVHTDNKVENYDEAMMMCLLIAMREALGALAASIEIPGHPGLALNEQVSIIDTASGANTRMWLMHRSTTWTGGERAEFKTTLQGAMIDSPDLYMVGLDYLHFLDKAKEEAAL